MVIDQLVEGLEVVECFQEVAFLYEFDWALLEELIVKQGKERLAVVEIHCFVR